ncbi:MAG: PadR family transcriptional regulator [Micrococcaceae bacterium]
MRRPDFFGEGKNQMFRARRGDISSHILMLLADKPMHGYEIITKLEEQSGGMWRPSPGSVYPTLQLLEEQELVTSEKQGKKKVYSVTEAGEKKIEETKEKLEKLKETHKDNKGKDKRFPWDDDRHKKMRKMRKIIKTTMESMFTIAIHGTDEEFDEARDALKKANKKIKKMAKEYPSGRPVGMPPFMEPGRGPAKARGKGHGGHGHRPEFPVDPEGPHGHRGPKKPKGPDFGHGGPHGKRHFHNFEDNQS